MDDTDDTTTIRRAVEAAQPDALRLALAHATGDGELIAVGLSATWTDAQRRLVHERAVAYLASGPGPLRSLDDEELRVLMEAGAGARMTDEEFESRRGLVALDDVPWDASWNGVAADLPGDFTVAVIGAGFSGIAVGAQLARLGIPFTVYERRHEVGGVWSINQYPDARVDTASFTYEFNFEKNHPWSEHYARQGEVRAYLEHVAKAHGVWDSIVFGTELARAEYDEDRARWDLILRTDGEERRAAASVVVTGMGLFANAHRPAFEGAEGFRGVQVHPSAWPGDLDLSGLDVALVGNGSTGVQLAAPLADRARRLYVFQRTPQWISPRANYREPIAPEARWLLDHLPGYWNWLRYATAAVQFPSHAYLVEDEAWIAAGGIVNEVNDRMRSDLTEYIHEQVADRPELAAALVPDYAPMTRRPVVDNGWYAALTREHVELVTAPIARLTGDGVETTDGVERHVDVIVTATGFDVARYLWPAGFTGADGVDLHDAWDAADGPRAYLGMLVPRFPNLFMMYGPNSQPVSGGVSLPAWYQIWARYIGRCLVRMLEAGARSVRVRPEAFERYNQELDERASQLIILTDEKSVERNYYVRGGRLQVNSPFESPDYFRRCSEPDPADLEFRR